MGSRSNRRHAQLGMTVFAPGGPIRTSNTLRSSPPRSTCRACFRTLGKRPWPAVCCPMGQTFLTSSAAQPLNVKSDR